MAGSTHAQATTCFVHFVKYCCISNVHVILVKQNVVCHWREGIFLDIEVHGVSLSLQVQICLLIAFLLAGQTHINGEIRPVKNALAWHKHCEASLFANLAFIWPLHDGQAQSCIDLADIILNTAAQTPDELRTPSDQQGPYKCSGQVYDPRQYRCIEIPSMLPDSALEICLLQGTSYKITAHAKRTLTMSSAPIAA